MAGNIFKDIFKKNATEFKSVQDVNSFVEEKTKKKLKVKFVHGGVSSCRGSVFKITPVEIDANFNKALSK